MAPELLTSGRASKASDIYAAGILLWELFTGRKAWAGHPAAMLPLLVVQQRRRPPWPPGAAQRLPAALVALVEACWAQEAGDRCVVWWGGGRGEAGVCQGCVGGGWRLAGRSRRAMDVVSFGVWGSP
jgi:hypothetical protein